MAVNSGTRSSLLRANREFMLFGLSEHQRSWRGLTYLFTVYLGSLLFAAIVAPWAYHGIQWLYGVYPETFHYLAHKGFEDYFDRLRWVPVVLALPWLFARTRLWSIKCLGISFGPSAKARFLRWWLLGALLLFIAATAQMALSPTHIKPELAIGNIIGILLKAIAGGLLLGVLEEILFRGLILRLFYTATGPFVGILLAALFFSCMHFKMPDHVWHDAFPVTIVSGVQVEPPPADLQRVSWSSGFFVAKWTVLGVFVDFQAVKFTTLIALGVLLSLLALRGSLISAIGMHAGIVTIMLSYGKLMEVRTEETQYHLLLGGRSFTDGIIPLILILLMIAWLLFKGRTNNKIY